jgi:type VI secretion system protein ImpG
MNESFLKNYEEELGHIREVGSEFGRQYPRIAGRLAMGRNACDDPFVERMIEGFAFLAARVRSKLDAEYPKFCESLLETIYPQILGPVPSMAIVELHPDPQLAGSFKIPRGTTLTSHLGTDEDTRCEFRTAHDVMLHPVRIMRDEPPRFFSRDIDRLRLPAKAAARSALRLRIGHLQGDKSLDSIEDMDELVIHVAGNLDVAGTVYEELMAHCSHVFLRPVGEGLAILPGQLFALGVDDLDLCPMGFEPGESLLPSDTRTFEGYRLLREFATLPERYLFFRLKGAGLKRFVAACASSAMDVVFVFNRSREELARLVDEDRFKLFATPAINLFEKRADQIQISRRFHESHVVVDKTRTLGFEVFQVKSVRGVGEHAASRVNFEPFYRCSSAREGVQGFFTVRREPRQLTHRENRFGAATSYTGSEVYLSVVDGGNALHRDEIVGLSVVVTCSNRHLPLCIPIGEHETDFFVDAGLPLSRVRCLKNPTRPIEAPGGGDSAWQLISHLSLNYLSLVDDEHGASALREILGIYTHGIGGDAAYWTGGLVGVASKPIIKRHRGGGAVAFVRGLEVTLTIDESKLAGSSVYVLGAVLSRFIAKYVSINSFVDTVVESTRRGVISRWSGVDGKREIL